MHDDREGLTELAVLLGCRLKACQLVLATAESCTGGWVAECVTSVAGSSDWFDRGFVTYSNAAKVEMLGIDAGLLQLNGAVSEATVQAMAAGALQFSRAQVSVAVSGIAGPGGGVDDKPVGTVWFAWQREGQPGATRRHRFEGDRQSVRQQAVVVALQGLIKMCDG